MEASPEQKEVDEKTPLREQKEDHKSKPTICSRWQAPIQSRLRPAMWIPGVKRLHSHKEVWQSPDSSAKHNLESLLRAVMKVIETDTSRSHFNITKMEDDFVQIHVFTRMEWLDIIEIKFIDNTVKLFFWVPFLDLGMNQKRLMWILTQMDVPMHTPSQYSGVPQAAL